MRKSIRLSCLILISIFISSNAYAAGKRVFGFLGDWHSNTYYTANGVQYEYLTDVVYSFILPQSTGAFGFDIASSSWYSRLSSVVTHGHAKGVKVHVAAGGWGSSSGQQGASDPIHNMCNNETARDAFVQNVLNLIKDYDLDGFNMDWEYPSDQDTYVLNELLLDLKKGMLALENEMGKKLELSIAVGAGSHGTKAYDLTSTSLVDLVMIMAFDNAATHHSTVGFANGAMDYWLSSKGMFSSQLVLGVPFYSRGTNATSGSYRWFSNSDPAGFYNDADGILNNYAYNSRPVLEEKINEVTNRGGQGIFVWEITEDRTDQYSLLNVLYSNLVSSQEIKAELSGVSAYPNPVTSSLNIQITDQQLLNKGLSYVVSDITGKQLIQGRINQLMTSASLETIVSSGILFVTVTAENNQKVTFKVIKK